jgi:lipopolysaccharide export system protein LptC
MSSRRSANRLRMVLVFGGSIGLVLGSLWLLQVVRKGANDTLPAARRNEPDYYVEKFNFVRMSKAGEARYNIAGSMMIHRPQDDTYEITLPVINYLRPGEPALHVRAERAVAVPDSSKIHLIDRVEADRPASATVTHFHLKSDYLLVLPDEEIMRTDKPVDLSYGLSHFTGTGMYLNNATRTFKLEHTVRGTLPAHSPATRNAGGNLN